MALPTSTTWDLAHFASGTLGGLLTLGDSDVDIEPTTLPYLSYASDQALVVSSRDGVQATLGLNVSLTERYTVEVVLRVDRLPNNAGDLAEQHLALTAADDNGRGFSLYFTAAGLAFSRVDDFGSAYLLPDTADFCAVTLQEYQTLRVAVDGTLGRAYLFTGSGDTAHPTLEIILPVSATPSGTGDTFEISVRGSATHPVSANFSRISLAGQVIVSDLPPTAHAGEDQVASLGSAIRFDGRGSYDVENADLEYEWTLTDVPSSSVGGATVSSGSSVDDGDSDGFTNRLACAADSLPEWLAVGDLLLVSGRRHVISTVNHAGYLLVETDTIPDDLTDAVFRVIRQSLLVAADTDTPYLVPDAVGIYRAQLRVYDGTQWSVPAEVIASVRSARTPFGVEPKVDLLWKALGDEWQYIADRGVYENFWIGTAQVLSARLLEAWQYHFNFSIRDIQPSFQRKWQAYRTLITDTSDDPEISMRYGPLRCPIDFVVDTVDVTGEDLVLEEYIGGEWLERTATLTGNTLVDLVASIQTTGLDAYAHGRADRGAEYVWTGTLTVASDSGFSFTPGDLPSWVVVGSILNIDGDRTPVVSIDHGAGTLDTELSGQDVGRARDSTAYRPSKLAIRSANPLRVSVDPGLSLAETSTLGGDGAPVTDRSYLVEGVDLADAGVVRGDLLVLNNGQSFEIDRLITHPYDEYPNQRVLLYETLPLDASESWEIPSIIRTDVDYEAAGAYPGDLVKFEAYNASSTATSEPRGIVVGQKTTTIAANLWELIPYTEEDLTLVGVKRRKGIPLPADVLSIPRLQEIIPVDRDPTIYQEQIDYVLEPFYRDVGGEPLPYLQFRDSVFIEPDLEPPDIFWAELTVYSNDENIENNFGARVGFTRDSADVYEDFNYKAGVAGLTYSSQRGPNVAAIKTGAQILLGQSFAEVNGVITEVRTDYSPTRGRILIQDDDGFTPSRSETYRTYFYRKDPGDVSDTSGLAPNPDTDEPWAVGDSIPQFSSIGLGVDIVDIYKESDWAVPYIRSGELTEVEKFMSFLVRFDLDLTTLANLALLNSFINKVAPERTHPILLGLQTREDDVDLVDTLGMTLTMHPLESLHPSKQAFSLDDYDGAGNIVSYHDDGSTFHDGLIDCPYDVIIFIFEIDHPGGTPTFDSIFYYDTDVVDVDGAQTGTPGSTFSLTLDMTLAAGTYQVTGTIKAGKQVLP